MRSEKQLKRRCEVKKMNKTGEMTGETIMWLMLLALLAMIILGIMLRYNFFRGGA